MGRWERVLDGEAAHGVADKQAGDLESRLACAQKHSGPAIPEAACTAPQLAHGLCRLDQSAVVRLRHHHRRIGGGGGAAAEREGGAATRVSEVALKDPSACLGRSQKTMKLPSHSAQAGTQRSPLRCPCAHLTLPIDTRSSPASITQQASAAGALFAALYMVRLRAREERPGERVLCAGYEWE